MSGDNNLKECICPVCSSADIEVFFAISQVPVHCNILWPTRNEAKNAPRGDIRLGVCKGCGHIFNLSFDPGIMNYTQEYESSLHFSPRFQDYARSLATRLIDSYGLHNKDIIEIGCGNGEFLMMLCELGGNRGVGFDQSFVPERANDKANERITFIKDLYTDRYKNYKADFICCRQVLEHVSSPLDFLINLRHTIDHLDTKVFFEVPDVLYTLRDLGIWDIIYEHCSYFNTSSLTHLLNSCGFKVSELTETFDGQFLCIDVVPVEDLADSKHDYDDVRGIAHDVDTFSVKYQRKVETWQRKLEEIEKIGQRVVLWGAGSKGVTFLNTLKVDKQIKYVIDINPRKHGKYVPGSGQKIVSPEFLHEYKPDIVIIMNTIYNNEIRQITKKMNVTAKLVEG